jgi:hypothetical protein
MPNDLPTRYAASYYLGEIVRGDTWVENELKLLWQIMSAALPSSSSGKPPRDFAEVLRRVRALLSDPQVGAPFRMIALEVLDRADVEHKHRRHLVHEVLMQPPWYDDRILTSARSYTFEELEGCSQNLKTITWRVRGLHTIAAYWLPPSTSLMVDGHDTAADLVSWTRVAMGHISDDRQRVIGTDGPCPEPPGGYSAPKTPPTGFKTGANSECGEE